jgi:NAD(P)-dependent dehydrogenase (short-subunit alcohol dehydrogenase family)
MAKSPRPLHGRVVAITGGARGIGRATATALAREGARVAIGDIDADLVQQAAREIGGDTVGLRLDVTDRDSFAGFLDDVERRLGPVDVLVNNAGIMPLGDFADETPESSIRQVDINLHGVITGTRLAIQRMRPRGGGHVVNIASYVGKISPPGAATYVATKHAVVGLTESVMMENREYGIEFTVVMPGVVKTEMGSGVAEARSIKHAEPEDVAAAIMNALRVPRLEVYVPPVLGPIHRASSLLPRRAQEWLARLLKGERILQDIDRDERAAYEERAARDEPTMKPDAREVQGEPAVPVP